MMLDDIETIALLYFIVIRPECRGIKKGWKMSTIDHYNYFGRCQYSILKNNDKICHTFKSWPNWLEYVYGPDVCYIESMYKGIDTILFKIKNTTGLIIAVTGDIKYVILDNTYSSRCIDYGCDNELHYDKRTGLLSMKEWHDRRKYRFKQNWIGF